MWKEILTITNNMPWISNMSVTEKLAFAFLIVDITSVLDGCISVNHVQSKGLERTRVMLNSLTLKENNAVDLLMQWNIVIYPVVASTDLKFFLNVCDYVNIIGLFFHTPVDVATYGKFVSSFLFLGGNDFRKFIAVAISCFREDFL